MTAPQTIPRSTVIAAVNALGLTGENIRSIHLDADTITIDQASGARDVWRIVDECASCHAPEGRPHTDYCTTPDPWTAPLEAIQVRPGHLPASSAVRASRQTPYHHQAAFRDPEHVCTDRCSWPTDAAARLDDAEQDQVDAIDPPNCLYPSDDYGDGRGCQHEDCLRHGNPNEDGPDEPEPWIDNGCRCPNPNQHMARCPAGPHPYVEAIDDDQAPIPNCCEHCGQSPNDPRHKA